MKIFAENTIPTLICVIALIAWQWALSRYITNNYARPAPLTATERCTLRLIQTGTSETEIDRRCKDNGEPRDRNTALTELAEQTNQTISPIKR